MSNSYRRNKKVVKYQKTHFNIGTIAFVLIFIYIVTISISYFNKEQLSIYEVTEKQMSDDNVVVGFAVFGVEVIIRKMMKKKETV